MRVILLLICIMHITYDLYSIKYIFTDTVNASRILTEKDDFIKGLSAFDIKSRMQDPNNTDVEELINIIDVSISNWSLSSKIKTTLVLNTIDRNLSKSTFYSFCPDTVRLIRTSGAEEGFATAYTRQNAVILTDIFFQLSLEKKVKVLLHEMYHIASRFSDTFAKNMYDILNFKIIEEPSWPDSLSRFMISNPDVTTHTIAYDTMIDGENYWCIPITMARNSYSGGNIFSYLHGRLAIVSTEPEPAFTYSIPLLNNHSYLARIGNNSGYIIHPEEVLAENFVLAILGQKNSNSPFIINEMRSFLRIDQSSH